MSYKIWKTNCLVCSKPIEKRVKQIEQNRFCSIKCKKSLEGFISLYGDSIGKQKYNEYIESKRQSEAKFIKKYGEILGKQKWLEYNNSKKQTLENMIKRHGETLGIQKWDEYCEKLKYKNSKNRYIKEFGETLGMQKWDEYCENRKRNVELYKDKIIVNEENYIKRFGEVKGKEKWKITSNKKSKTLARNHFNRKFKNETYYLYIFETDIGIKIGISKDIKRRIDELSKYIKVIELLYKEEGLYEEIRKKEQFLHNKYDNYNIIIEEKFSGFTEFFDSEIKESILSTFII